MVLAAWMRRRAEEASWLAAVWPVTTPLRATAVLLVTPLAAKVAGMSVPMPLYLATVAALLAVVAWVSSSRTTTETPMPSPAGVDADRLDMADLAGILNTKTGHMDLSHGTGTVAKMRGKSQITNEGTIIA